MTPVWTIVSGKGGVGKSTLAASLAAGLAKRKRKVVLIDMDTGLRNQDMMLGLENRVVYDLVDVVDGNATLEQALVQDQLRPNLTLLSSSQIHDSAVISPPEFQTVIEALSERFAHIIIDCPSGISTAFRTCTAAATEVVVVTTPDEIALRDADRVLGLLRQRGNPPTSLVVNRIRTDWVLQRNMYTPKVISQTLDVPLIGVLPEDEEVQRCLIARKAVIESDAQIWQTMDDIVRRLLGERVPLNDLPDPERKPGLWARLFGKKRSA